MAKKSSIKALREQYGGRRMEDYTGNDADMMVKPFIKNDLGMMIEAPLADPTPTIPEWKSELLADPTYAAFERQFEYNRGKLGSDFIALKERLKRDRQRQKGVWQQQRKQGLQGINESMENRGLFRSGQRHLERGELKNRIADQRQRFIDQQGETREEARRTKRESISNLKRQRAEERVNARARLSDKDATTKFMA